MSSDYAQAGPLSVERTGWKSLRRRKGERSVSPPEAAVAEVSTPAELVEESSRFRPGSLSPVSDQSGNAGGSADRVRSRSGRLFDRLLLIAEITSALVVAWLVAQYIYTVYFDTA